MTPSEKEWQAMILQLVRTHGGRVFHNHDSRRDVGGGKLVGDADARGYPDLTIVTKDGRTIWAELKKSARDTPTAAQWDWLKALPAHQAFVWRPTDWDDAVRIVRTGHKMQHVDYHPDLFEHANEPTCAACQIAA